MPRPSNPNCYHEEVEHFGITVNLRQLTPDGNLYAEHRHFEDRFRKSLGTKDLEKARAWARKHCKEVALQKDGGALGAAVRSNRLTLGELFDAFRERGIPIYEKKASSNHVAKLRLAMRLLEHVWGRDLRMDQLDQRCIDKFVNHREEKGIDLGEKEYPPAGRRTTEADLNNFSVVLEWAHKQRYEGNWLLEGISPRKRFELPAAKPDSEISRPIADKERYAAIMEYADQIGQTEGHLGQFYLPMILRLVRHTGRRRQAVVNLYWEDICLDREACEAGLRRDQAPVKRAQDWPHGAIHWRADHNKMGHSSVIPIPEKLQRALIHYRDEQWPSVIKRIAGERWHEKYDFPQMPLFPSDVDPERAINNSTPGGWLRSAKKLARDAGRAGAPPADEKQGGFHAYRRWWASERSHYQSDMGQKAVRIAGGWKPRGDTMRQVYLQVSAAELYRVVASQEGGEAQAGIVSIDVLGDLVTHLVRELSNGSAPEAIRCFPDLETHQQKKLLWDLIQDVEKKQRGTTAVDSEPGSQKVVNALRDVG